MALIKCPSCGSMISDKAEKCPKCGCPTKNDMPHQQNDANRVVAEEPVYYEEESHTNKWLYAIIALLLAALAFGGYYAYTNSQEKSVSAETPVSAPQNEKDENNATSTVTETEKEVNNEAAEISKNISAGLTFRTFTKRYLEGGNTIQYRLEEEKVTANLRKLGFTLIDKTTESRLDYTGEDYYEVTILTYSKTVDGRITTVKLESEYTEIHFPNLEDVEEFKQTVRATGLKEKGNEFKDSEDVYWAGTDVSFKGTIVTLSYKWEP